MKTMNNKPVPKIPSFVLKDCTSFAVSANKRTDAFNPRRDHHFGKRENINDFAGWVRHNLSDKKLTEQLAVLDPVSFNDMEELRFRVLEGMDDRPDEKEFIRENFLLIHQLLEHLTLMVSLQHNAAARIEVS